MSRCTRIAPMPQVIIEIGITITSSLQPFIAQRMIDTYFTPSSETGRSTDERVAKQRKRRSSWVTI